MGPSTEEETIHSLRKQVDACIQSVGKLKIERNSDTETTENQEKIQREVALAYTKLQEAKMWLGKCLEMLGSELPAQYTDKA